MIQVLVLDRQCISRAALCSLLGTYADIAVVEDLRSFAQATADSGTCAVDVVVVDCAAMDDAGEALHELRKIRPSLRTLLLADTAEANLALEMFGAGVDGYVTKHDDVETLLAAIRQVAAGTRYICPGVGWRIARSVLNVVPRETAH